MNSLLVVYLYANLIPYQENVFQMCFCIKNRSITKRNFRFLRMTLMPCRSPAAARGLERRHGLGHDVGRMGQKKEGRSSVRFQLPPPLHWPSPGAGGGRRWAPTSTRWYSSKITSSPHRKAHRTSTAVVIHHCKATIIIGFIIKIGIIRLSLSFDWKL